MVWFRVDVFVEQALRFLEGGCDVYTVYGERVAAAVRAADAAREARLRAARAVGRVVRASPHPHPHLEPRLRQLTFKWQRGLKIGAGSFGKVPTYLDPLPIPLHALNLKDIDWTHCSSSYSPYKIVSYRFVWRLTHSIYKNFCRWRECCTNDYSKD